MPETIQTEDTLAYRALERVACAAMALAAALKLQAGHAEPTADTLDDVAALLDDFTAPSPSLKAAVGLLTARAAGRLAAAEGRQ